MARELEREFGHARVQGAHIERDGKPRPPRTPGHKEHQQGARTGVSPQEAKELITGLWRSTDSGKAFRAALEDKGWLLARGDRRDFVAIDPKGGTHSLSRRIEGAKASDVRQRMADIDPRTLPSVAEAKQTQQQRHAAQERARPAAAPTHARASAEAAKGQRPDKREGVRVSRAAAGMLKGLGKALDGMADSLASLLGGGPSAPEPRNESRNEPRHDRPLDAGASPSSQSHEEAISREDDDRSKRRQAYLRDFDREVPEEGRRDAEIERDRSGRERRRGE